MLSARVRVLIHVKSCWTYRHHRPFRSQAADVVAIVQTTDSWLRSALCQTWVGGAKILSNITALHGSLVDRVVEGEGRTSPEIRRAAFANAGLGEPIRQFVEKVAHSARTVSDADIRTLRDAGLSEDQIYEIVVCAALGQATRQYQSALAALSAATGRT